MTQLAIVIFIIDVIKLIKLFITSVNSVYIKMLFGIILILGIYIIFIGIIWLIVDLRRYNFTGDLLIINLKLKENALKKNKYHILLCKLLHVFRKQTPLYYHNRIYVFILKYEYIKAYIHKYSFKIFIKKVISIKFKKIDIFILDYYYKWLMIHNASLIKGYLRDIRHTEIDITIFYIKKIKENLEDKEIIIKRQEYEPLVLKDKEYKKLQKLKKILNKKLIITTAVNGMIKKKNLKSKFSYYYMKCSHIFFHYSLSLFWLLTTTKVWFMEIKLKVITPYIKEHVKFLIHQKEDKVILRKVPIYQNDSTHDNMGHSKVIIPSDNWKITDTMICEKPKYVYHYRVNIYTDFEGPWHINRDNKVWDHFSGVGGIKKHEKGIQTVHPEIGRTHWGSEINFNAEWIPVRPTLGPYLKGYRYLGYPERCIDYFVDLLFYFEDYIRWKYDLPKIVDTYDINYNDDIPAIVINFNVLFLVLFFHIWIIFTIILLSRRVQIWITYFHFYFIFMFLFSIYFYFQTYLEYFDHNFIIASFMYIIKLPFNNLNFNISNLDYLYIFCG